MEEFRRIPGIRSYHGFMRQERRSFRWLKWLLIPCGVALAYLGWDYARGLQLLRATRQALAAEDYSAAQRSGHASVRCLLVQRDQARLLLAEALLHRGRVEECVAQLNRLRGDWARCAEAQLLRGEVCLAQHEPLKAEWIFQSVVARWPNEQKAHRWLAAIYYDLGHIHGALEHLKVLNELCPDDPRSQVLMATIYMDSERYRSAAASYLEAHRRDPSDFAVRVGLADALVRQGDIEAAEPHLLRCHEERPEDPEVRVLQAECARSRGELDQAAALCDQVLAEHPDHRRALLSRAKLHIEKQQPEAAVTLVERILQTDPYDWQAHYQAGLAYARLGKTQEKEEAFEKVRRYEDQMRALHQLNERAIARPRDPEVRYRLGELCLELGKPELAEMWFQAALMTEPHHQPTHRSLERFYADRGQSEKARWHAEQAGLVSELATP